MLGLPLFWSQASGNRNDWVAYKFNQSVSQSLAAPAFVSQVYLDKHGQGKNPGMAGERAGFCRSHIPLEEWLIVTEQQIFLKALNLLLN